MSNKQAHRPVMLQEAIRELVVKPKHWYVDATLGGAGHTQAMLELGARVIAFDFDQLAIQEAQERFHQAIKDKQLYLINDNFKNLPAVLNNLNKSQQIQLSGVLFDLGTSSKQLMSTERGFSFNTQEGDVLDMRMDQNLGVTAGDLLLVLSEKQLSRILSEYGGERDARAIAKAVQKIKKTNPDSLHQAQTLLDIIDQIKTRRHSRLHPATKTFQALRIAVNDELNNLELGLQAAFDLLKASSASNKRLVTIAFHEGEDRIVKHFFRQQNNQGSAQQIYKKPLTPSAQELKDNPRSRSAKLRVLAI